MLRTSSILSLVVLSACFMTKHESLSVEEEPLTFIEAPRSSQEAKGLEYEQTEASLVENDMAAPPAMNKSKRAVSRLGMSSVGHSRGYAARQPTIVRQGNTEQYTDYGVNGFALVERDALSTFAIDVDTASYTIARKKLNMGYLPPTSAVRVEEFVNYFPYEYRQPGGTDPFSVDIEAAPSPWNTANHLVRIGVQGKKVSFDKRKSVHLTFLVDVSGSMNNPDKLGLVKNTLKMLTEELEDGDTVAIATYAGATKIVLEPTPISKRAEILGSLSRLTAGGSTAMGAGIDLAYALADKSFHQGAVNRVIVASDGDANVGQTSHSVLSKKIESYAAKGITLTTVGVGNGNYKDTMMEQLANKGDGNYVYLDSMMEARRVFSDRLTSTMEVIAKDVKIQVEWDKDAVIAYRLVGYENRDIADRDFRNDQVDAGEIGSGHQVTAIYEVAFKDQLPKSFGTVRVRNKAPGADAPAVERAFTLAKSDIKPTFEALSADSRLAISVAGFAEILRGSKHMNEISVDDVHEIAKAAARAEYPEDQELLTLMSTASRLRGEGTFTRR
jgi:Ca-activated chloride channel family protein